MTWAQTKIITDSLQDKLNDTIYENAKLRAQLFDKGSEQKDTTKGTSAHTKFANQSTSRTKLYSMTPLLKIQFLPKVVETIYLSKPVTSNSVPTTEESKVMKNDKVITLGMFRINPFKTSRKDKFMPINKVRASKCLITANHDVYALNYMNDMNSYNSYTDNQNAKVSNTTNQKKLKAKVKKSKKLGSKEIRASPKPRTPRTCLRWSPTRRTFGFSGKLIESSDLECQPDSSKGDNACTSNPQEPTSKRFPNSTSFLGRSKGRFQKEHLFCQKFRKENLFLSQKSVRRLIVVKMDADECDLAKILSPGLPNSQYHKETFFVPPGARKKQNGFSPNCRKTVLHSLKAERVTSSLSYCYSVMAEAYLLYAVAYAVLIPAPESLTTEPFSTSFNKESTAIDGELVHVRIIDVNYTGLLTYLQELLTRGAQFLGEKLVSWSSKKQDCTALSTAEAEYVSLSACCAQVLWMRTRYGLWLFHFNKIPIYCDSEISHSIPDLENVEEIVSNFQDLEHEGGAHDRKAG
ncbi:hypothetical protein Tco_0556811 [Tanacetum coccineum]